jgi:hypothetical protein
MFRQPPYKFAGDFVYHLGEGIGTIEMVENPHQWANF